PEPVAVIVDLAVGDVRITASDRRDSVVQVRPSNEADPSDVRAAEQVRVECAEGRLTVKAQRQWRQYSPFGSGGSVEVTLEVPTGSSVEGSTSMGALHAEGELGPCRFKTSMGNLRLDHTGRLQLKTSYGNVVVYRAAGDAAVTTGTGDIRIGGIDGAAVIKNSNGDTDVGDVRGDVHVKAANGDIAVSRAGGSVTARSACGDIRVGEVARGEVALRTTIGEIDVGVRS